MNKRLIGIFVGLFVVVALVILSCAVFVVGDIVVQATSGTEFSSEESEKIIFDSKILKFSSIFSVSKTDAQANIENANPYLKVLLIERKAPNRIVINVCKRVGYFAVPYGEKVYLILDSDLKVLEKTDSLDGKFLTLINGVTLPEGVKEGDFVQNEDWLRQIAVGASEMSFIGARFGAFVTSIDNTTDMAIMTTNTGVKMVIYKNGEVSTLMKQAYNFYLNFTKPEEKNSGYITIGEKAWVWRATL